VRVAEGRSPASAVVAFEIWFWCFQVFFLFFFWFFCFILFFFCRLHHFHQHFHTPASPSINVDPAPPSPLRVVHRRERAVLLGQVHPVRRLAGRSQTGPVHRAPKLHLPKLSDTYFLIRVKIGLVSQDALVDRALREQNKAFVRVAFGREGCGFA
jgi:hypothetical protein